MTDRGGQIIERQHPELLAARLAQESKDNPDIARGAALQRSISALRGAHHRKINAEKAANPLPALIDGTTGEILDDGIEYREGPNRIRLPVGVAPADVPAPACASDYAQVCRGLYGAARQRLTDLALPHGAQLAWVDLVMAADPETGGVDVTAAEVARRCAVDRSTATRWLRSLADQGLIEVEVAERKSDCRVTILNYDEIVRLELRQRVQAAERVVRRRRVIEEEVTTTETTRETITRRRILEEISDDADLLR